LKREELRSVGEEMMKTINELNIHLTGSCRQSCAMCPSASRQFLCCAKNNGSQRQLPPSQIATLLAHLTRGNLDTVNVLGGDPLGYTHWDELQKTLAPLDIKKTLVIHYKNLTGGPEGIENVIDPSWSLKVLVDFPMDHTIFAGGIQSLQAFGAPTAVHFVVSSEAEFETAAGVIDRLSIETAQYHPLYTGANEEFFRQGVFIDRQTLQTSRPSTKDIHARQTINPLNFGNLTILANGDVHANLNAARLGNLRTHSLYDMVYKEMLSGKSWRRTRSKARPCDECLYSALCPPLSNYEHAFGRNDLCELHDSG